MAAAKKDKTTPPATPQYFPIVGVGASAGGLDAFKRLLKAIPEDSGMAYVLVQHLDPAHESALPDILSRATKIPVHEITDDIHLAPDHIYIIPSNKILTSSDGVLKLSPRDKKIQNLPIDVFFTSLAEVHKEFAVGVVLSGTGRDGTQGLKSIKAHRGITIAQDLDSSAYDGMPQSAIDAGVVDFILSPEKIPDQLLLINSLDKTTVVTTAETSLPKDDENIFKQILTLIRLNSGVDFTYYKQPTPRRRIARRMAICKTSKLSSYLKILRGSKTEQDALFQDMLIPVTAFLRDVKTFNELCTTIIPLLVKNKSADEPIRVWIAGCSTGEEAYSIAICLHEYCTEKLAHTRIQIFASDISEVAIKKARSGIYSKADVQMLTEARLKTYFIKNNGGYEVNKLIRDMCVFAPHNFLKDPPFAKMDLISCRNSLIYMDTFLQKKALTTFHYALRENGFLMLGKSETTGTSSDLFVQVGRHEKIYSRKTVPSRFIHVASARKEESLTIKDIKPSKTEVKQTDFRKSAEAMLLAQFTPAGVIVNDQSDIVHIHGAMSPFLEQSPGKPTFNLLKMVHEGLSFELRNAIHKVKTNSKIFTKENIPVSIKGKQALVNIQVIPLVNTVEPHFFILFNKSVIPAALPTEEKSKSTPAIKKIKKDAGLRIQQVENQLAQAREDMRSITEDQEAANEELQSANEELLSSSEEMQSLNEELETSKEELQSTNEELIIINQELLDKQEQLNTARFYSESIVTTLREPLIVLDKTLRIKTANAAFYKKFNVEEKEIENKLFYEIQKQQFDDTLLRSLLENVLPQKNRIEDFEIKLRLPDKGERIILINARQIVNEKRAEQLILLAMEDITDRVLSEKIVKENESRSENERKLLHDFFTQAPALLAILKGPEHVYEFANPSYMEFIGNRNIIGKKLLEAIPEASGQGFIELLDKVYNTGETFTGKEMPVMMDKGNGKHEQFYLNFTYQAFANDKGEKEGILIFAYDVTEQIVARKLMEASEKRFSNILEQSIMAISIFKGREMRIAFMNEPMIVMYGKGRDVIGKTLIEVLPEMKDQPFPQLLDDVYTTGVPYYGYEMPGTLVRNGKAEKTYFNFVYQPYREVDNSITGITVIGTEVGVQVHARKKVEESEARFRTLAESIPNMIWTATPDGQKNFFNKYFLDYTGLSYKELKGNGVKKIIFPDDLKRDLQLWRHSLKTGEDFNMEKRLRHHDGTYRWHLSHAIAQKDLQGNILGWIGSSTEIEEQKKFTEELEIKVKERTGELQTSNEELKQTNTQLDQFAHVASHDLQEPLRKIITFSKRLQENHKDGLPEEVKTYLNKIEGASSRMTTLIRDLLNFSRLLQHEKLFTQVDLNVTLKNILNDFELQITEKKAVIKIDNLPTINAIPLQMNQLFYNLLSNALKFANENVAPHITISSRILSEKEIKKYPALTRNFLTVGKGAIEIIFKDNGIGFDKQYDKQIFTIFQRLHNSEKYLGTGIGLALCKKIIENHQGEIFVFAKENKGAAFHILLPVK